MALGRCAAVSASLLLAPHAQAADYNVHSEDTSGAWSSFVMQLGEERHSRAATVAENDEGTVLAIDSSPGGCDRFAMTLNVTLDHFAGQTVSQPVGQVALRVDTGQLYETSGTFTVERGSDTAFLALNGDGDLGGFYSELLVGSYLRVRILSAQDEQVIARFSLNGSRAALDRATVLCEGLIASDEQYFESEPAAEARSPAMPQDETYF